MGLGRSKLGHPFKHRSPAPSRRSAGVRALNLLLPRTWESQFPIASFARPSPQPSPFRARVQAEEGLSGGGPSRKLPRRDALTSRRSPKGIFHLPLPLRVVRLRCPARRRGARPSVVLVESPHAGNSCLGRVPGTGGDSGNPRAGTRSRPAGTPAARRRTAPRETRGRFQTTTPPRTQSALSRARSPGRQPVLSELPAHSLPGLRIPDPRAPPNTGYPHSQDLGLDAPAPSFRA